MRSLKSSILTSRDSFSRIAFGAAFLLTAVASQAEVINHEWVAGDGLWGTKANWSPAPTGTIGSGRATALDRVTINSNVTVTHSGSISFFDLGTDGLKAGTFNALTLTGGATLNVGKDFRVSTASGGVNAAIRNVLIDSGSSLIVGGSITTGTQNSSGNASTWTVKGTVTADTFLGQQSTHAGVPPNLAQNGGFILKIDGGSFTIANTFNWKSTGGPLGNLTGQITLSNNGIFSVGTMENWLGSTENYVDFADGTGIFSFDYGIWTEKSDVQTLIDNNYIRMGSGVIGEFDIIDTGSGWQVSINAIPEPSTYAMVAFGVGAAILLYRKGMLHPKGQPSRL